jgi:hypothetical protein
MVVVRQELNEGARYMDKDTDDQRKRRNEGANPSPESHAKFAGDTTGAVGGSITPMIAPDKLQHEPQTPDAHQHDPGTSTTDMRDDGWVKEGQGSQLAQEREGVPESEIPHNMPESATQPRPKA